MSYLFDIFTNQAQTQAAQAQTAGINAGINQLQGSYGQGVNALNQNYTAGLQPFQQNYANAAQGQTALGNALGLNGQQGSAAALQAFQSANPGYGFQLQQGENAVLANQAATGQLASGNTNLDLTNYGQGLANQSYNQYVQNLQPYLGAANSAASGIGGLYSGLGNQLNANYMGQGNAQYGAQSSIGNANANAALGNLNASGNIWGAATGAAKLVASLSDARLKDDIEPVGELYDGQPVFRYRFRGDHRHQLGLIAQEVEKSHPETVVDMGAGIRGVDYKRATDHAASRGYAERLMKVAA